MTVPALAEAPVLTSQETLNPSLHDGEFTVKDAYRYARSSAQQWLLSHIFRYKLLLLSVFINAVGNAVGAFMIPFLIGSAFTEFSKPDRDLQRIALYAALIAVSQLIRAIFHLARNASSETVGQRLERNVRDELYTSLLAKSMTFHSMQSVGDIMARATNDVREMNLMMNPGVNLLIGSAMFLLMPLILSPLLHPQLLLVPIAYIIAWAISLRLYSSKLRPATETVRAQFGKMNAGLAEAIDGVETVKGASQEALEVTKFSRATSAFRDAFVRQSDVEARFIPLLLWGIATAAGLLHSLLLYRAGALTSTGQVITYVGYLQMFGFPTWTALFAFSNLSLGLAASKRIYALLEARNDLDANPSGYTERIIGQVTLDHVTFRYPDSDRPALQDVTFAVQPGQVVAIVGQTGAGKSTLTKLINRTYDVTSGRLLVDGVDVRDWQLAALRSQISIIEQDIFLFSRSISDNIRFGKPDASQAEVEDAAKAAQAHDFILSFKDGYETVIGSRGVTLSGGQRQRIALARAFLTNPRLLILDDSTSAIDSATEDQIQRAIHAATQNRTTFLITHRLSQIRWADLIVVLRKGAVIATGKHEELLDTCEPYRNIFVNYDEPRPHTDPVLS